MMYMYMYMYMYVSYAASGARLEITVFIMEFGVYISVMPTILCDILR